MEFIKPGSTLPYPFNIIPSPKSIGRLFFRMISFCCIKCQGSNSDITDGKPTEGEEVAEYEMRNVAEIEDKEAAEGEEIYENNPRNDLEEISLSDSEITKVEA